MGVSVIIRSLQEPVGRRRAVLRALCASRVPMSIAAIAGKLGVHPNTVRFHLDNLVADGQVERVEPGRGRPGRPPLMFRAVRRTDSTGTRRYRLLAEILASGLAAERDSRVMALSAGGRGGASSKRRRPVPTPRRRSTTWSRCLTTLASLPSAGHPTAGNRSVCGTVRFWNSPKLKPVSSAPST